MKVKEIIIATKNPGKAKEFKDFFKTYHIQATSLLDFKDLIDDVEETGTTFKENAALKAKQMASLLNKPVLADDSGLMIDALNGRPGVYSARYAGEPTNDQANIKKVLQELKDIPKENRTARFVCVLAIAGPGMETIFRTGYCEGEIAMDEKGSYGFGYDPIFIPEGHTKRMAELKPEEKNEISHRSHAVAELETWIKNAYL